MRRSCLLAAAFTFLAGGDLGPILRAQTQGTLAGSWVGVYQTYPHFIKMTLQIAAPPGQPMSGEMRLEPVVNLRSIGQVHMGIVKVTVAYDASARTLVVTPAPDSYRNLGFQMPGFSGVLDEGRQLVGGVLTPMPRDACPYFILGRAENADGAFVKTIKDALEDTGLAGGTARPQNPFAGMRNPFGGGGQGKLREWAAQFSREHPDLDPYRSESGGVALMARNLFRDEYFRQYFGKTFDELGKGELNRIVMDIRGVPAPRSNFPEERANGVLKVVERAFSPTLGTYTAPDITLSVLALRPMAAWREQAIRRLASVPPTGDGLRAINGSRAAEQAALSTFWPSERKTFADAVGAAQSRVAAPLLTSRVDAVLTSATSFAGAETIANVLDSIQRYRPPAAAPAAALPPGPFQPRPAPAAANASASVEDSVPALATLVSADLRAAQIGRLDTRMSELVRAESERDLQTVAKLEDGLPGLEASGRAFASMNQKYVLFPNQPSVRALYDALAKRRGPMFRTGESTIAARVKAAKSTAELNSVRQTYLGVPSDSADPVGGRLLQSVQLQMNDLQKAEAIVAAVKEEERRRAASPCAKAATRNEKNEEGPTEQEMCLTVEAVLEGKQEAIRSMEQSCKYLRPDSNPATALACLMGMGAQKYRLGLRGFYKVACAEARPFPGFVCDYQPQFSTNVAEFQQILGRLPGGNATARFVFSRGMWVMIPFP